MILGGLCVRGVGELVPLADLVIVRVILVLSTCRLEDFQGCGGSKVESLGRQVACRNQFGLHAGCPSEGATQNHECEIRESVRTREGR